jgi:hypothetical protein
MRTIFRSPIYVEQVKNIPEQFSRTRERLEKLEEELQKSCDGYPGVVGKDMNYWRIVGGFRGVAPTLVFFHYDDERIVMLKATLQINVEDEAE